MIGGKGAKASRIWYVDEFSESRNQAFIEKRVFSIDK